MAADEEIPAEVLSLASRAKDLFDRSFGPADGDGRGALLLRTVRCASAPGRVNLLG